MIKKIIYLFLIIFFSSTAIASVGDITNCSSGNFKIKKFIDQQNRPYLALVDIKGWFSRDLVQTIVPEEDIESCLLENKNIVVGGSSGLTKIDDRKLLSIKSSKPDYAIFSCFCKLNKNLLDGCRYDEGDTYMECSKDSGSWTREFKK